MSTDKGSTDLQILGGGPAGLAAAYYARKASIGCTLYEGSESIGGNAQTHRLGDCLFDTGAHRLHDKIPDVTDEIRSLLGPDLLSVRAPSRIHLNGKRLRFPLSPTDLLRHLDWTTLGRIAIERARRRGRTDVTNFKDWAIGQYGETLARMLLLDYSEKLWGEDTSSLSATISGGRLRNLDLRAFLRSLLPGDDSRHLDGDFLYPKYGFGTIFDRVAESVGQSRIRCDSRITKLSHEQGRIQSIETNGQTLEAQDTLISTLPLTLMLQILDPEPPPSLLDIARSIRFRKLLLCVYCLKRSRFSENASIYFPDPEIPFTRLYESKNRSAFMAPEDQTAIVIELPCHETSRHWQMDENRLLQDVLTTLGEAGQIQSEEVLESAVYRLPFAYPILEVGIENRVRELVDYLERFANLHLLGRNATFRYLHTHDLFSQAKSLIGRISGTSDQG